MFWYQINPNYFKKFIELKDLPGKGENLNFYKLVELNLKRIKDLNCDGIWIMPLYIKGEKNKKGQGSPYAIKEFEFDTVWGEKEDLKHLINEIHKNGLKVITEYIPNHLAPDSPFVLEHPEAVYTDPSGNPLYDQNWSDTVKLKHKDPIVQEFTRNNIKRLVNDYGFDGFRMDMAHCPFYDIDGKPYQGEWDSHFWRNVLDDEFFKINKLILIGEVYDDRNHDYAGYGDHIRLMKNNMIVYDKKIHDHLRDKLKNTNSETPIQEIFYRELEFQYEAMKVAERTKEFSTPPFLRIPSNHDDNPGIKNFGGVKEYILAFLVQTLMYGHSMIYNADEYGLSVRLSVALENITDEEGNLLESTDINLVDEEDQKLIYDSFKKTLNLRKELKEYNPHMFIAKGVDREGNLSSDILVLCYKKQEKILFISCNLSHDEDKKWFRVMDFYPSLDEDYKQYFLPDFLRTCGIDSQYRVKDLYNGTEYGIRKPIEEFWVGLGPLEIQILEITPA